MRITLFSLCLLVVGGTAAGQITQITAGSLINPQVLDFELHRSSLNNDQVGEIAAALPNVRRLALKPNSNGFDAGAMKHLKELGNLEVVALWSFSQEGLYWDDGISHLAEIPSLKRIETNGGRENWPALKRLKEVRPDIEINSGKAIVVDRDESWMGHS